MNEEELLDEENEGPIAFAAPDQDFDGDSDEEPADEDLDEIDAEENEADFI